MSDEEWEDGAFESDPEVEEDKEGGSSQRRDRLSPIAEESRFSTTLDYPAPTSKFSEGDFPVSRAVDEEEFRIGVDNLRIIEEEEEAFMKEQRFIPDDPRFALSHHEKEKSWEPSPHDSLPPLHLSAFNMNSSPQRSQSQALSETIVSTKEALASTPNSRRTNARIQDVFRSSVYNPSPIRAAPKISLRQKLQDSGLTSSSISEQPFTDSSGLYEVIKDIRADASMSEYVKTIDEARKKKLSKTRRHVPFELDNSRENFLAKSVSKMEVPVKREPNTTQRSLREPSETRSPLRCVQPTPREERIEPASRESRPISSASTSTAGESSKRPLRTRQREMHMGCVALSQSLVSSFHGVNASSQQVQITCRLRREARADFSLVDPPTFMVGPGEPFAVRIQFTPTKGAVYSNTLYVIFKMATELKYSIPIKGYGGCSQLVVSTKSSQVALSRSGAYVLSISQLDAFSFSLENLGVRDAFARIRVYDNNQRALSHVKVTPTTDLVLRSKSSMKIGIQLDEIPDGRTSHASISSSSTLITRSPIHIVVFWGDEILRLHIKKMEENDNKKYPVVDQQWGGDFLGEKMKPIDSAGPIDLEAFTTALRRLDIHVNNNRASGWGSRSELNASTLSDTLQPDPDATLTAQIFQNTIVPDLTHM